MSGQLLRKMVAEGIGTFALVFAGCGAIMVDASMGGSLGHVGVSLTFGLVVMVMIYATGHISGAHFNPAVTIAFASTGRFPWSQVPAYVASQLVAATLASCLLYWILGPVAGMGGTSTSLGMGAAVCVEVLLTFMLMFVITAVATDSRAEGAMAGLAIGGTVTLAALMGGPLTGASMNPARSLGPAIVSGSTDLLWVYLVAPIVGAVVGALVYRWTQQCEGEPPTDAAGCC